MATKKTDSGRVATRTKSRVTAETEQPSAVLQVRHELGDSNDLRERITARAYALYEARGCLKGGDLQDWLDAERETLLQQPPA